MTDTSYRMIPDSERIRVMNRGKYTLDSNPRFLGFEARIP